MIDPKAGKAIETAMRSTLPKPPRRPLDPITRPLWRLKRRERAETLEPFIGKAVELERWYTRVASGGDHRYKGTLLAVAITTIGSAADLAIIQTVEGTVWAISTAQIAYLKLAGSRDS